ncbi:NAD(P)/FAD-dependent oxidoreductase [Nanoarchaeota archaeon]
MYDTIIIGAGISGLTAALYAERKKMNFKILATQIGGQFMVSGEVLNYPGIIKTTGVEFLKIMEDQMKFNNVKVDNETVKEIKKVGTNFKIITDKGKYDSKSIIMATGSKPRMLNVPGEGEFAKKGVTYCSICDGPLFAGKDVAVIGGGDSALEAVDFLKDIVNKIYMIVRGDKFKGHQYLIDRVTKNKKVECIFEANTSQIVGDKFVTGLKYEKDGKETEIKLQGVIIEAGRLPNTELVKDFVKLDPDGHIMIDCQTHSSVPGLFAAGDCGDGHEYQYVIAAGQGSMALIKAARYLSHKEDK